MPSARAAASALLACLAGLACSSPDDATSSPPTSAATSGGTTGASSGGPTVGCPESGPNPEVVEVAGPAGPARVTRTEITRCQYAAFASEIGEEGGGTGFLCAWNDSYLPDLACMDGPGVYHGDGAGRHPQPCIDWCDAQAYCAWVGMHLCRGPYGAPYTYGDFADPARSEWMRVCSSNGNHAFPYGDAYDEERCNGACTGSACATREAGTMTGCRSPDDDYAGVLDTSGNVREWEDLCDGMTGATDACRTRGGSFESDEAALRCAGDAAEPRNTRRADLGFRCCG